MKGLIPAPERELSRLRRLAPASRLARGFTLIELLITISITAILSSFLILYTSAGRAQVALYVEEAKIAQIILKSKSLAIATYATSTPVCGYGLHVNYGAKTYSLFNYKEPNCGDILNIDPTDPTKYQEVESYSLNSNLDFQTDANSLDNVLFVPPEPKTLVWAGGSPTAGISGNVELKTVDGLASAQIKVGSGGQVTF